MVFVGLVKSGAVEGVVMGPNLHERRKSESKEETFFTGWDQTVTRS